MTTFNGFQFIAYYDADGFSLDASNNGIGPAKILSLQVAVDQEYVKNLDEMFVKTIGEDHGLSYDDWLVGDINNKVIEASYDKYLLRLIWNEKTREFQKHLGRVNLEIVYASIFDECWKVTSDKGSEACDCPEQSDLGLQFTF